MNNIHDNDVRYEKNDLKESIEKIIIDAEKNIEEQLAKEIDSFEKANSDSACIEIVSIFMAEASNIFLKAKSDIETKWHDSRNKLSSGQGYHELFSETLSCFDKKEKLEKDLKEKEDAIEHNKVILKDIDDYNKGRRKTGEEIDGES